MDGESIKISIVLPVYNKEQYLPQCLESILNQTLKEFELLCMEDGSSDSSLSILKKYASKDRRIQIVSRENRGAGYSRNEGLALAKGKYVQFLDADDFFEPDMLEQLYIKAEQYNADVTICNANRYNNETGQIHQEAYLMKPETEKEVFSYRDINDVFALTAGVVWNKLYNRKFFVDKRLQFQNIYCRNDFVVAYLSLIVADRIACVEKRLINYRFEGNKNSITTNRGEHLKCSVLAYQCLKEELICRASYKTVKSGMQNKMIGVMNHELQFQQDREKKMDYVREVLALLEEPYATEAKKIAAFQLVQEDEDFWKQIESPVPKGVYNVFGTGRNGKECSRMLEQLGCTIENFYDNDAGKQGTVFCGKEVRHPRELINSGFPVIVATTKHEKEICRQLEAAYALKKGEDYLLFSKLRETVGKLAVKWIGSVYFFKEIK